MIFIISFSTMYLEEYMRLERRFLRTELLHIKTFLVFYELMKLGEFALIGLT